MTSNGSFLLPLNVDEPPIMAQMLLSRQAALVLTPKLKPHLLPSPRTLTSLKPGSGRRSVAMAALPGLFPHPPSAVLYVMEAVLAVCGPLQMHKEAAGKANLSYSKFAGSQGKEEAVVSSRTGMFVFYFPAAVAASVFLAYRVGFLPLAAALQALGASGVAAFLEHGVAAGGDRLLLVAAALSIHHVKRCLEVLFVHKPSGSTGVKTMGAVATSYFLQVGFLLYSQLLSAGAAEPSPDLKWLGVALFSVGILGNGYHHWMLAHLRKDGIKKYVVPRGALFELFVCPHYIFEMMDYIGLALISQTLYGWCMASFTIFYLTGRSIATKEWYKKKVEGFPEDRSVLIPGVF